ncbi:MAG: methylmalonyl Co-A mutase-associated GTPase MeaB [Bacteroidales bacterium]|nr:methylmalonyl Co-A mutase-associated GTPase MeaB [Bacteroidales bacterium]
MDDSLLAKPGNYKSLVAYQKAEVIYEVTYYFCSKYLQKGDRTIDQMIQAARSGKQNIVEGSAASSTSSKTEIFLINVAKASLKELLEDYIDYLNTRNLSIWAKGSAEYESMRKNGSEHNNAEYFMAIAQSNPPEFIANMAIILLNQTDYLLFRLLDRLSKDFLENGGFAERMKRMRTEEKRKVDGNTKDLKDSKDFKVASDNPATNKRFIGEVEESKADNSALAVTDGVVQPPQVNPNIARFRRHKAQHTAEEYIAGILRSDINILGQAITMVESVRPEHQAIAQKIIEGCLPHSGKSIRIGITGVPGAGKSTFIEALGVKICDLNHKLAVLAVDPSSERSGGSILGDKTRMENLTSHPNAFVRPSPSAGSLGGVARKTRETIILCEAAGFDTIFVETVGVGQSETAVHSMVDFFLLLLVTGAGDDLQGIKRGIMEMADAIAITKADGENITRAQLASTQYQNALHLFPMPKSRWTPIATTCSALSGAGIMDIWEMITKYVAHTNANGFFDYNRNEQAKYWLYETINEAIKNSFYQNEKIIESLPDYERKVLDNKISSFVAAHELLAKYFEK